MKPAFTLIELLVVMAMLSILMLLVGPSGAKILESTEKYLDKKEDYHQLGKLQFDAFLSATALSGSVKLMLFSMSLSFVLNFVTSRLWHNLT